MIWACIALAVACFLLTLEAWQVRKQLAVHKSQIILLTQQLAQIEAERLDPPAKRCLTMRD